MRRRINRAALVEGLEFRRLLATITVTSTADTVTPNDGAVTLREAITAINAGNDLSDPNITAQNPAATNAFGTKDTIDFNITGTGLHAVSITSDLPAITAAVTIDGYSQSSASAATTQAAANIEVAIDGTNVTEATGFTVEAQDVTIDGLMIYNCAGNGSGIGIELTTGSGNDSIWGDYIGNDGTQALGNDAGIVVTDGSSNNTIGGTTVDKRNVISGNYETAGISMFRDVSEAAQVTGNVIEGNYIGTDATGTNSIPNENGIEMSRTEDTTIGGTTPGARNVISGNSVDGVGLNYHADDTTIEGNFIGVTADGSAGLGNSGDGINISVADGATIGSTVAGEGNVISDNGNTGAGSLSGNGIEVDGGPGATIINNFIGTDATGMKAIGNKADGILLYGEDSVTVGGTDVNTRNVISGNANGIELIGSMDSTIEGNYIGTDVTGASPLGNTGSGVVIDDASDNNTIGGTAAAARNLISGNGAYGVAIDGTGNDSTANSNRDTTDNVVEGNYIGTDVTGSNALGDGSAGVYIDRGAEKNEIGGTNPGAGNLISGIAGAGVYISGITKDFSGGSHGPTLTNSNTVEGNYIGTDATGAKAVQYPPSSSGDGETFDYSGDGVYLEQGAFNNTIGGTSAAARNIISGNSRFGIFIGDAHDNTVEGNYVGVDVTGSEALGNALDGVFIEGENNVIGGTSAGAGNVISGNGTSEESAETSGIQIDGGTLNVVQGNDIGTDATGTAPIANFAYGVLINGEGADNTIGGNSASAKNIIAYNNAAGVAVVDNSDSGGGAGDPGNAVGNTIHLNSIFANKGLGIDLNADGITPNDPQDADTGPNNLQNYPVLVTTTSTASSVTVTGTFNSVPSENFTLDFYANDTADAHGISQGKQYLGSVGVITDAGGNATFNSTFNVAIGNSKYITATATNESTSPYGDTSEFSQAVEATTTVVTPPPPPPTLPTLSIGDISMNEGNSGTTAFTFTITRSGDLSGGSSVAYSTADGTATLADHDYQSQSNTVGFDPGQATKTVTILVNGDTKVESDETFSVTLSNPSGATLADGSATGTILNDDVQPPPPPPPTSGSVSVVTDPCDSTKKALEIDGTDNKDTITVTKSGSSQGKAVVKINGVNKGTFSFSGSIVVYGKGGADNISIDSGITRSAYIWGGDGNDTVNGGGGNDIIFGQGNDDSLNGNGGRDILVGGDGTDKLNGGSGDDLLIAGDFKSAPSMSQLCSIQKEWTRTDKNYAARVKDLTNGGGFNSIKLNSSTLFSSTSLKDSMTGGSDNDLFFAAMSGDKITDKASGESAVNIG